MAKRGVANSLTEQQITEYREVFTLFDQDNNETVKTSDLPILLRSLGLVPTQAEVTELMQEVDPEGTDIMDFNAFLEVAAKNKSVENPDELREAFRYIDQDSDGKLMEQELRHLMTQVGEKLTDEELADMMKVGGGTGNIKYDELVKMLLGED